MIYLYYCIFYGYTRQPKFFSIYAVKQLKPATKIDLAFFHSARII